jgi:hypothetical protein
VLSERSLVIHENQQQIERILDRPWLGLAGTGGSVGFLEIFIGDGVRFCGSAKFGQFGFLRPPLRWLRQDADGRFAGAQLGTQTFPICLVQAETLVVKRTEAPAGDNSHAEADRRDQG